MWIKKISINIKYFLYLFFWKTTLKCVIFLSTLFICFKWSMIRRSFLFIATQNICLSSAINASYQSVAHRSRLKFGIVWNRIAIFTQIQIIYLSVVFSIYICRIPLLRRVYAVRVFVLFSRLVKRPQTYLAKYFFLSPLAFGFIVLLVLPTKRNETQREETKRETKRNATKQNSNWISNSNLNLNSSKAFVINSKIHTPCRAENRALTAEEWERGERGVRWGAVCCCLSLVLVANVILFKH